MPRLLAVPALAVCFLGTLPALAQANDSEAWDGGFGQKSERRSDVVIGFSPGLVLTSASGYPNKIDKLNVPEYEATSGLAYGPGFEVWLGGALTDWFSFGLGAMSFHGTGSGSKTTAGAGLFRVELFPLYTLGGGFRDLALFANFGAGGLGLSGKEHRHGESGLASVGGGGVAYELLRAWHFAFAPSAEYMLISSQSLTANQVLIGVRGVFYGGPG